MLGALEPDEHLQIEELVEQDHELNEELKDIRCQVAILDHLDPPGIPLPGLARRTCEHVASQSEPVPLPSQSSAGKDVDRKNGRRWFAGQSEQSSRRKRNPVVDIVMIAVFLILMASIALPALNNSRFNSRLLACQNNMRDVGMGLLQHAENSGGKYMQMPTEGNLSFAGSYAPKLLASGLVKQPGSFLCPGVGNTDDKYIPTLEQILSANGKELQVYQKQAGGDLACAMGQMIDGNYYGGEDLNRSDYILLADKPSATSAGRASKNHGGYGQNVFFETGRTAFLKLPEFDDDAIYENDWGTVAPGANQDDIVLVPSATRLSNHSVD